MTITDEMVDIALSEFVWEKPVPFTSPTLPSSPYPIQALPTIIRHAVVTYQTYGQQPLPLLTCSALANVSLACQLMAKWHATAC